MDRAREKPELTGLRFGKLTVIAPAEEADAWLCRCLCGRERVVKTCRLRSGCVTDCGCKPCGLSSLTYVDSTCLEMIGRRNNIGGIPGEHLNNGDVPRSASRGNGII